MSDTRDTAYERVQTWAGARLGRSVHTLSRGGISLEKRSDPDQRIWVAKFSSFAEAAEAIQKRTIDWK